eukprot:TRINITY_DN10364_c0_g1_i1.p1 TRINITY_DN10364_c0_g1~~TRINITY_DN10364_c0_g1_i1.p1  ORF type:complete len:767 (+),score=124.09 TRINITY_DN10364_c0_g1_i1:87-2387(+)
MADVINDENAMPLATVPAAQRNRVAAWHGGPDETLDKRGVDSAVAVREPSGAGKVELRLGCDAITLDNLDLDSILGSLTVHDHAAHGVKQTASRKMQIGGTRGAQRMNLQQQGEVVAAPTRASAKHSLAHGPALAGGVCGERLQFTVTAVTEDGRVCDIANTRVAAHVTGLSLLSKAFPEPRPWIEDRKDGTYLVQFVCATPGQYHVSAFIDGILLPMCPVTMEIRPGPPSAMFCDVTGEGKRQCQVGSHAEFIVQTRDEFGNACNSGGHRIGVRAVGHAKLHEVCDNEDGSYSVCYSLPEYAQGPVHFEVLLDGVPIKDSPVQPSVQMAALPQGAMGAIDDIAHQSGHDSLVEQLKWIKENPPRDIPDMPEIPQGGFGSNPGPVTAGSSSEAAAARHAWRAADEWRRLAELRDEMSQVRASLLEHREALAMVGNAVHAEAINLQGQTMSDANDLAEVQSRLNWMRSDLTAQAFGGGPQPAAIQDSCQTCGSPRTGSPVNGAFPEGDVDAQMSAVQKQLNSLHEGIETKRRWLKEQEAHSRAGGFQSMPMGMGSPVGRINEVPPPEAPPALKDSRSLGFGTLPEPAAEMSPGRGYSSNAPRGGVLRQPPPPPSPPPAFNSHQQSMASPSSSPSSPGMGRNPSPEELGHAMKKLFRAFASRSINGSQRGRNARMALGLVDYTRLANAAQLRIPHSDLEDAFQQTVKRYGGSSSADGEKTLAFEIFVELLVETARKRYGDLSDQEGTTALFEDHLLPLARQLEETGQR